MTPFCKAKSIIVESITGEPIVEYAPESPDTIVLPVEFVIDEFGQAWYCPQSRVEE